MRKKLIILSFLLLLPSSVFALPDLIIQNAEIASRTERSVRITITFANIGDEATSNYFHVGSRPNWYTKEGINTSHRVLDRDQSIEVDGTIEKTFYFPLADSWELTVDFRNSIEESNEDNNTFTLFLEAPPTIDCAPHNIAPFVIRCSLVRLEWGLPTDPACEVEQYRVIRYRDEVEERVEIRALSRPNLYDDSVSDATTYNYVVQSLDRDGEIIGESNEIVDTPPCADCTPQDFSASLVEPWALNCPEVRLQWNTPSPIDDCNGTWQVHVDGIYRLGTGPHGGILDVNFVPADGEVHEISLKYSRSGGSEIVSSDTTIEVPPCPEFPPLTINPDAPCSPRNINVRPSYIYWVPRIEWWVPDPDIGCEIAKYGLYRNGVLVEDISSPGDFSDRYAPIGSENRYVVLALDGMLNPIGSTEEFPYTVNCLPPKPRWDVKVIHTQMEGFTEPVYDLGGNEMNADYWNQLIFTGSELFPNPFSDYIEDVSYGLTEIAGGAYGPYPLSGRMTEFGCRDDGAGIGVNCNQNLIYLAEREAALASGDMTAEEYDSTDVIIHVTNGIIVGSGDDYHVNIGLANGLVINPMSMLGLINHEMGHSMISLWHSGRWDCDDESVGPDIDNPNSGSCRTSAYGPFSPIGAGHGFSHHHALDKEKFGWLTPDQTHTAVTSGSATYRIDALEIPGGVKQIKIPLPVGGHQYLVEYRKPIGFDGPRSWYGISLEEGIYVRIGLGRYVIDGSVDTIFPVNGGFIRPGTSFVDPYRGVTIEVVGMSLGEFRNQADIRVTWDLP